MNKSKEDISSKKTEENKCQIEKPINVVRTRHDYPPLTFGARRIHYQFSAVLPTIHLTLVSILQGLAFGVLLLGVPITNPHQIYWFDFLLNEYFYLPYLSSSLLILLIWKEFAQACFYSNWPLSSRQAGLIYLNAVPEILAFRAISTSGDNPKLISSMLIGWLIGIGFVGIIGGLIRLNNNQLEEITDYEFEEIGKKTFELERSEGFLYIVLGVFMTLFGLIYEYEFLNILNLFNVLIYKQQISWVLSWIIVVVILTIVSYVFWQDMIRRKELLDELLKNSDLKASNKEVIRYSQDIEEEPSEMQLLIQEVKELHALISTQKLSEKVNNQNIKHSWPVLDRIVKAFGKQSKKN